MMDKVEQVEEAMTKLIGLTNTVGSDQDIIDGMVNALVRSHPTLAQSFYRALRGSSQVISTQLPYWLDDGRLRGSKGLVEAIAAYNEPIPFI